MEYIKTLAAPESITDLIQVNLPIEDVHVGDDNQSFIVANTVAGNLRIIREHHTIPAFAKDNEPLISHADFIAATTDVVKDFFIGQRVNEPSIRLSHEVKGRIPSAKNKVANDLEDWEKTIFYTRIMFCIEIPGIQHIIDGNIISLTVGGVKSYSMDNLYSKKGADEHFKIFVGFKVKACTNLSVWSDGLISDLKVTNIGQLKACIYSMLQGYNQDQHLYHLKKFTERSITEQQFAQVIGRCRMYTHLPSNLKTGISPIMFGDQQINCVVKDFYRDESFCRDVYGNINLWKLHNLFTGTNKSSYIDSFLDRSVHAHEFVEQLRSGLDGESNNWYLS